MDLSKHVGYMIKCIGDKMNARTTRRLKKFGLTMSQFCALSYIYEHGGVSTQKDIEKYFDISHPTVVGVVAKLEQNGYLTCSVGKEDHRFKVLTLTEKGKEIGQKLLEELAYYQNVLTADLSPSQIEALREALAIVYKNLED